MSATAAPRGQSHNTLINLTIIRFNEGLEDHEHRHKVMKNVRLTGLVAPRFSNDGRTMAMGKLRRLRALPSLLRLERSMMGSVLGTKTSRTRICSLFRLDVSDASAGLPSRKVLVPMSRRACWICPFAANMPLKEST
ncbi:hypothetical protein KC330_g175 [Hortaea werneckii]|nr:hypothetical protein KC330_g175 [Hortaea werneckii]